MLLMGWDGTEVTPQIRNLIVNHHLGSIILTAKNLKCSSCIPVASNPAKPICTLSTRMPLRHRLPRGWDLSSFLT